MTNWVELDPIFINFTPKLQNLWEGYGFTCEETKQWLNHGLKDYEFGLATYLKNNDLVTHLPFGAGAIAQWREHYNNLNFSEPISTNLINTEINSNQDVFLTTEIPIPEPLINSEPVKQDWKDINKDFSEINYDNKTYQQFWEENGLTYQDAKELIVIGFTTNDYYTVKYWKDHGFTAQQVQEWIKAGLNKNEYELATYLKYKGYTPDTVSNNIENLRAEPRNAKEWIDCFYPLDQRKELTKLYISNKKLTGSLIIGGWDSLQELNCDVNKITSLDVGNCENLNELYCFNNQLTALILPKQAEKLTKLNASDNQLTDLNNFINLINCEELDLDNNLFLGSLEPLKYLIKLKVLRISKTRLDSGLEHLHISLKRIYCEGCEELEKKLKIYSKKRSRRDKYYSYEEWRKNELGGGNNKKQLVSQLRDQVTDYEKSLQELNEEIKLLKENPSQNKNTTDLEQEINRLKNLVKKQKEKIVKAYTHFFCEKQLLRNLINVYLEYSKAKKLNLPAVKLLKQKQKIYDELETKIGEEAMEEVEMILKDCDELINSEFELETKEGNKLLLEDSKSQSTISHINVERLIVDSGHVIFGSGFGNNNNLGYHNKLTEILPTNNKRKISAEEEIASKNTRVEINNWTNIHISFSNQQLIQSWMSNNFTYEQTQEWANVFGQHFNPHDYKFITWLRDVKQLTPEQCLNHYDLEQLKTDYQAQLLQINIEQPPKPQ